MNPLLPACYQTWKANIAHSSRTIGGNLDVKYKINELTFRKFGSDCYRDQVKWVYEELSNIQWVRNDNMKGDVG